VTTAPSGPLPRLSGADAFVHVIYEHRYFCLASFAWQNIGDPLARGELSRATNEPVPGVGVLIQDSLLLHGRNLIDFYTKANTDPTDIVVTDFGLVQPTAKLQLEEFRDPIAAHLMHLTNWRDVDYRAAHAGTRRGQTRDRPDWNIENARLIAAVLEVLDEMTTQISDWQTPFCALRDACRAIIADPTVDWPPHLGDKDCVDDYLRGLNLR
jgi:hypothetical protein